MQTAMSRVSLCIGVGSFEPSLLDNAIVPKHYVSTHIMKFRNKAEFLEPSNTSVSSENRIIYFQDLTEFVQGNDLK